MKDQIVTFEKQLIIDRAREYVVRASGFDLTREVHCRRMEEAEEIRRKYFEPFHLSVLVSEFPAEGIRGETAQVNGVTVCCEAFSYFSPGQLRKGYAYLMGAEGARLDGEKQDLLTQFYRDLWETSCVDAGRDLLRDWLQERNPGLTLSDSFGPGYYGMALEAVDSFFQILDGEKIGMRLSQHGVMTPAKSCAGFYLALEPGCQLPPADCRSCVGNAGGCQFCKNRLEPGE